MREFADEVRTLVKETPGTWDINDSWGVSGYQLHVDVNQDSANLAGVSNLDIANTLNAYYSGHQLTGHRRRQTRVLGAKVWVSCKAAGLRSKVL